MVDRKHARRLNNSQSNPTIKYYYKEKRKECVQQRVVCVVISGMAAIVVRGCINAHAQA